MSKNFNFEETQDFCEFHIVKYSPEYKILWNQCVENASNSHFLFYRDYMEYHADRYKDHSLLVFYGEKLVAVFPATEKKAVITSHGGLTFGGLIHSSKLTTSQEVRIICQILRYYKERKYYSLIYKPSPWTYHSSPCEGDIYAISSGGGHIIESHLATAIDYLTPLKFAAGRKNQIHRAQKNGVLISESKEWDIFTQLLGNVLMARHNVLPVHTPEELSVLQSRFPDNIKLWVAKKDEALLAAVVIFITSVAVHTQYMVSSDDGCYLGALDLILAKLISDYQSTKRFFCFGISTEGNGRILNEGLLYQKESFGGRAVVHNIWEVIL